MGPHHFRDKRIESAHQLASRFLVMPKRSLDQRIRFRIIHVQRVSTLQSKTALAMNRLQGKQGARSRERTARERRAKRKAPRPTRAGKFVTVCRNALSPISKPRTGETAEKTKKK